MFRLRLHLIFVCFISIAICSARARRRSPRLTGEEETRAEAEKLDGEVGQLFQRGQAADAVVKAHKALEIRAKLFPASKYPTDTPTSPSTLNDLGFVLQAMGSFEKALP